MLMEFDFRTSSHWPSLAWVAELRRGQESVKIQCGPGVELRANWFCEAVWDGYYEDGNFDQTDIVAGSGGRLRGDLITFVSSGSSLDRLHYFETGDRIIVSNSLSAIIEKLGAVVDVTYPHYQRDFGTVCHGLNETTKIVASSKGDINLVYFENLTWDGDALQIAPKRRPMRDFSSFTAYRDFMQETMQAVVSNAADPARNFAISPLVPLSSGYDSTAVAVLARDAGVRDAFTIETDRNGEDDSGTRNGEFLGYDVHAIDRDSWRKLNCAEAECIAGSGTAGEVAFLGLRDRLRGRLLLSGVWGGLIWDKLNKYTGTDFQGQDGCGLCLTEVRLEEGFIHCPVPFWGGHQAADLLKISQSEGMENWSIGGNYDRPVARRIAEEAGIPRHRFGTKKHGSSDRLMIMGNFLSESSLAEYESWITANSTAWLRKGRIPPFAILGRCADPLLIAGIVVPIERVLAPFVRRLQNLSDSLLLEKAGKSLRLTAQRLRVKPLFFRRYTFPWALERSRLKYRMPSNPQ